MPLSPNLPASLGHASVRERSRIALESEEASNGLNERIAEKLQSCRKSARHSFNAAVTARRQQLSGGAGGFGAATAATRATLLQLHLQHCHSSAS
jgi:hypothetical protein